MSHAITVRLPKDLAVWLEKAAKEAGVSQGKFVREQLEKARASSSTQTFLRLAGVVRGPRDLSTRQGFAKA